MNDGINVAFRRGSFTIRKADGVKKPPAQHSNMRQAEEAAALLVARDPEATFIISQEVARVTGSTVASGRNLRSSDANRRSSRTPKADCQLDQFGLVRPQNPDRGPLGLARDAVSRGQGVGDGLLDQDGERLGGVHCEIVELGRAATAPRDLGIIHAHADESAAGSVTAQAANSEGRHR